MNKNNLILIIPDELRADCTGFMGNGEVKTPRLDNLARGGAFFANHFTNHGKCVPSRACLFTGQYANINGHRTLGIEIQKGENNMAATLKDYGYETHMFMRNHTVDQSCHGDSFDSWQEAEIDKDKNNFIKSKDVTASEERAFYWGPIRKENYQSSDSCNTDLLCRWLEERQSGQPFFANINYINPHPPYNAHESLLKEFPLEEITPFPGDHVEPEEPVFMTAIRREYGGLDESLTPKLRKKIVQAYYAQTLDFDNCVGQIENTLKATGLWESTIVVILADHGDYVGQYNLVEKWDTGFQDCLLHVPVIITGGGYELGPRKITSLSEHVDIYPTICELLEIPLPYGLNGVSLMPLLRGEKASVKEEVFAEGGHEDALLDIEIPPDQHNATITCYQGKASVRHKYPISMKKAKMIRTRDFKYIYRIAERDELYDLAKDPGEIRNVAGDPEYAGKREELKERLLRHMIIHENHMPFDPHPIA